jgi:hypothetical protein
MTPECRGFLAERAGGKQGVETTFCSARPVS